jgi:predicted Zn finger-like uncharacterized protein
VILRELRLPDCSRWTSGAANSQGDPETESARTATIELLPTQLATNRDKGDTGMPIQTKCPSCKAQYKLADTMLGKKVKCKKCFDTFVVLAGTKSYGLKGSDLAIAPFPFKEMSNRLFYANGHRIECDNCQTPFVYVGGGTMDASISGLMLLTSDTVMQQQAFHDAITEIPLENVGRAICPHCHCYQDFMVKAKQAISPGIMKSLIVLSFFTFGIPLLGILLLYIRDKYIKHKQFTRGPHPDIEDPHSMTDEKFAAFLARADGDTMDPFLAWWINCGNQPDDNDTPLPLGLADKTGSPRFPNLASTESIMQNYLR